MWYLVIVSLAGFSASCFFTRLFQLKFDDSERKLPLFQAFYCLFASFCFALCDPVAPILPTLLFGSAFGVLFFIAIYTGAECYLRGSMALTGAISNMSLIVPVIYSTLLLKENITVSGIIGIVLFAAVFTMSSYSSDGKEAGKRVSPIWIFLVSLCFVSNGITAVLQKSFRLTYPEEQNGMFMAFAYFTAALIMFARYYYVSRKKGASVDANTTNYGAWHSLPTLLLLALGSGVGSFGGNMLLSFLSNKIDGAILYPVINGGLCLTTGLVSFLFFREKVTRLKLTAFIIGIIAIVLLNL